MKCVQLRAFEILLDLSHLSLNLSLDLEEPLSPSHSGVCTCTTHTFYIYIYMNKQNTQTLKPRTLNPTTILAHKMFLMHSLATQKCPKPLCPRPFWLKDVHDASIFVGFMAGPLMLLMLIQAPWQARVAVYKISARGFSSTKKKSAQYKKPKRTGVQGAIYYT